MLQIEYQGKFLHLAEGSAIEIDRSSPLFLLDNVLAEYSLPITLIYDDFNAAVLGDVFFDYGIKAKRKIPVNIYDAGSYCTAAVMIIDKSLTDHSVRGRGNVSGFLLTGISDFFSTIKDKKLNSLYFDGVRSFPFTSWDATDMSAGWWQHFHDSWDGLSDYIMIPHRNEGWIDETWFDGWVNQLGRGYRGGLPDAPSGQVEQFSWVVLFPKLSYVLGKLFTDNGWSLDTTGLNDEDWKKLFLFNVNPIITTRSLDGTGFTLMPMDPISFKIGDMISPEIYCADFLLSLCKRYGWAPIFNSDNKSCRLVALKESIKGEVKDFSAYANRQAPTDFSADLRIFNFTQNLPTNEQLLSEPSFTNYTIQPPVASFADLPAVSVDYDKSLVFCFLENAWYKIDVDADANRIWIKFADNVYNYEQDNNTDEYQTNCCTVPHQLSEYRETATGQLYYGYFLRCKTQRNQQWGLRTVFYHGLVTEKDADGVDGSMQYPLCSPVNVLPDATLATSWSNVYVHSNGVDDYGLKKYWFDQWLRILKVNNVVQMILNLPLQELSDLQWDDVINVRNQPYLIKKYVEPRPYKGFIQAEMHPLLLNDADADQQIIDSTGATGSPAALYVKLTYENLTPASSAFFDNLYNCDVIANVYYDAAGTVPAIPSAAITISMIFKSTNVAAGVDTYGAAESHVLSSAVNVLWSPQIREFDEPGTSNHFIWGYDLQPGSGYIVIP